MDENGRHQKETLANAVARLASLSETQYALVREQEAQRLEIGVAKLDELVASTKRAGAVAGSASLTTEVAPCNEPVDGQSLVSEIEKAIKRFVIIDPLAYLAIALWVIFTWVLDCFEISPRLHLLSAEKQSGKTTLIKVLSRLVRRPFAASRISPSAFIRFIETERPTLLIDEGDAFLRDSESMRGLLDCSEKDTAYVVMSVPRNNEWTPKKFLVWAAIVFASIGALWDTVEDRSIAIWMRRRKSNEKVEKAISEVLKELVALAGKVSRWALDHRDTLKSIKPPMPEGLSDRAIDIWQPLLAIAELIGGDLPRRAREAAIALSNALARPIDSVATMLLEDIRQIFQAAERALRLPSKHICDELAKIEERPWAEFSRGKPITPHKLAAILKPFGIHPFSNGDQRLYAREDFEDAWVRYLPVAAATEPWAAGTDDDNPDSPTANSTEASQGRSESTGSSNADGLTIQDTSASSESRGGADERAEGHSTKPDSDLASEPSSTPTVNVDSSASIAQSSVNTASGPQEGIKEKLRRLRKNPS